MEGRIFYITTKVFIVKYKGKLHYCCGVKTDSIPEEFVQLVDKEILENPILPRYADHAPLLTQTNARQVCMYRSTQPITSTDNFLFENFIPTINSIFENTNCLDRISEFVEYLTT